MYRKLHVQVTEDHIANGVPKSESSCPIALAIREARPDLTSVWVCGWVTYLGDTKGWKAELPAVAESFVRRFDKGDPVSPIEFDIRVPPLKQHSSS